MADLLDLPAVPQGDLLDLPPMPQQPGFIDRMTSAAGSMVNSLLGSFQGTSPTHDYTKLGELTQLDSGERGFVGADRNFTNFDPAKHIVLMDTETNKPTIYQRDPKAEESPITSAGRVIGFGAMAPSSVPSASTVANQAASAQRLKQFEAADITPNLPAVTGSRSLGLIANTFREIPFAGAPVTEGIGTNLGEAAAANQRIAQGFGEARLPEQGGQALREGYQAFKGQEVGTEAGQTPPVPIDVARATPTREIGFIPKSESLYRAIPIAKDAPTQVDNTLNYLRGMASKFESNPAFGATMQPQIFKTWQDLLESGKGLTWDQLQTWRSFVGKNIRNPRGDLGVGPDEMAGLYGAISKDMQGTAQATGPDALKAFSQANQYYSAGLTRLNETMNFLKNTDTSAESAYYNLTKKGGELNKGADIQRFTKTLQSMPQEYRNDVAATMVNRMGHPTASQMGQATDFSVGTWATNWASLSDKAKDAAFGIKGTAQRDRLEALAGSINSLKNVERLGNPPGTAGKMLTGAALYYAWNHPVAASMAMIGGYLGSKAIMNPTISRWIIQSRMASTPTAWAAHVAKLQGIVDQTGDPDVSAFADALRQQTLQ